MKKKPSLRDFIHLKKEHFLKRFLRNEEKTCFDKTLKKIFTQCKCKNIQNSQCLKKLIWKKMLRR